MVQYIFFFASEFVLLKCISNFYFSFKLVLIFFVWIDWAPCWYRKYVYIFSQSHMVSRFWGFCCKGTGSVDFFEVMMRTHPGTDPNMICLSKILIFHTKYTENFHTSLRTAQFFFKVQPLTWYPGSAPDACIMEIKFNYCQHDMWCSQSGTTSSGD